MRNSIRKCTRMMPSVTAPGEKPVRHVKTAPEKAMYQGITEEGLNLNRTEFKALRRAPWTTFLRLHS